MYEKQRIPLAYDKVVVLVATAPGIPLARIVEGFYRYGDAHREVTVRVLRHEADSDVELRVRRRMPFLVSLRWWAWSICLLMGFVWASTRTGAHLPSAAAVIACGTVAAIANLGGTRRRERAERLRDEVIVFSLLRSLNEASHQRMPQSRGYRVAPAERVEVEPLTEHNADEATPQRRLIR